MLRLPCIQVFLARLRVWGPRHAVLVAALRNNRPRRKGGLAAILWLPPISFCREQVFIPIVPAVSRLLPGVLSLTHERGIGVAFRLPRRLE